MELTIKIPDKIERALQMTDKNKVVALQLELAVALYAQNILSFGKAREFTNLSKSEFDYELSKRKIERHYDIESLNEDIEYAGL